MELHKLDTETQVFFYEQEFYFLSNFSSFAVEYGGVVFPTSEHLYHWLKFPEASEVQTMILAARSAHEAFQVAQLYKPLRKKHWDAIKVNVMNEILWLKVKQHPYIQKKLLETGERELIEDSWRDDVWGWGPNKDGQNLLGKCWMYIRSQYRGHLKNQQEMGHE